MNVFADQPRDHARDVGKSALAVVRQDDNVASREQPRVLRQLALEHFVTRLRLEIDAGVLRASVAGSQADPYQVLIHVPVLPRDDTPVAALRSQLNRLTPAAADLDASCNCVDHEALCKHAAAALLAFAFELKFRPELLIHWRTSAVPVQRSAAQVGTGTRRTVKPADVVRRERPAPVWASPEWEHFLGVMPPDAHDILANIPKDAAPLGRATVGTVDLTVFVRDAVAVLRGEQRDA